MMTPDRAAQMFLDLRGRTDAGRLEWWSTADMPSRLWLVARVDPLLGFDIARRVWNEVYNNFDGPISSSFIVAMEMLEDFVSRGGRLPRHVTSYKINDVATTIMYEERAYSVSTPVLLQALEYAARVSKFPGWYPPTAFDIYRAACRNDRFTLVVANQFLTLPVM